MMPIVQCVKTSTHIFYAVFYLFMVRGQIWNSYTHCGYEGLLLSVAKAGLD